MDKYLVYIKLIINKKFIGCFGVVLDENMQAIDAAPMGKWLIGKHFHFINTYYKKTKYNGTHIILKEYNDL